MTIHNSYVSYNSYFKKCPIPDIYEEKSQEPQEEKYPEEVEPQEKKVAERQSLLGKLHESQMIADVRDF